MAAVLVSISLARSLSLSRDLGEKRGGAGLLGPS